MANITSKWNKYNVFQGPAVVQMGAYGATPSDIGGIFNVSVEFGIEVERLEQGWPRQLKELYVKRKQLKVKFDSAEAVDYSILKYALGSCATWGQSLVGGETENLIFFGDQTSLNKCSLRLVTINVEGVTEEIYIWAAITESGITRAYSDDGIHQPAYSFEALREDYDWRGVSLIDGVTEYGGNYDNAQLCMLHAVGVGISGM